MFFLDVLLVAPNRTRPPMKIGLQIFEHAHNVSMGKVSIGHIQCCPPDLHYQLVSG